MTTEVTNTMEHQALAYGQLTDWGVTLREGGKWINIALDCNEANAMLNSGMVDGMTVTSARLLYVSDADRPEIGRVWFVYDFTQTKRGLPAWRITHEPE